MLSGVPADQLFANPARDPLTGEPIAVQRDGRYYLTIYNHDPVVTVTLREE